MAEIIEPNAAKAHDTSFAQASQRLTLLETEVSLQAAQIQALAGKLNQLEDDLAAFLPPQGAISAIFGAVGEAAKIESGQEQGNSYTPAS